MPRVGRGYIGRDDLTAAAFMELETLPNVGRLYKTGDRVRWLVDGNLDFLGRVDFQVKLNGQRIETGEIEATIKDVVGVSDVLVMLHKGTSGAASLVAYVLPASVNETAVMEACRKQLPPFMVPSSTIAIDVWPLNANGKIDRKALPAPNAGDASDDGALPCGLIEEAVAEAVKQTLNLDEVTRNSNLFSLGLTSLRGAVLVMELKKRRLFPSVMAVLDNATVQGIAKSCEEAAPTVSRNNMTSTQFRIKDFGTHKITPTSLSQQELLFFDQIHKGSDCFNTYPGN